MKGISISFNILKKRYYQRRYWNLVFQNMVKNTNIETSDQYRGKLGELVRYINKPGIAFSFDDSYRVEDWTKNGKDLFGFYDVKVTFNINAIHPFDGKRKLTQEELDLLFELQSNGHEIGHHGFNHKKATEYTKEYGLNAWIEDEIVSMFEWVEKQSHSTTKEKFKRPVSFAFPNFVYNEEHISALVPNYFKIVRGHLKKDNLTEFNYQGFAPSICLDSYYSYNLHYIKKIMKIAKLARKNLIFTCHSILPKGQNTLKWGGEYAKSDGWTISPTTISEIINEARKLDLEFYTCSEVAGVASFIDPNFERTVRELIGNEKDRWIRITELIEIRELDLSNKGITNLDGLQYFLNLEELNIRNNNIKDYRLLTKLPKLKKVHIDKKLISKIANINLGFIGNLSILLALNLLRYFDISI